MTTKEARAKLDELLNLKSIRPENKAAIKVAMDSLDKEIIVEEDKAKDDLIADLNTKLTQLSNRCAVLTDGVLCSYCNMKDVCSMLKEAKDE